MEDRVYKPEFPDLGNAYYLIELYNKFDEITHTEILSRVVLSQSPISIDEADLLIEMRRKYNAMKIKAKDLNCPAPYSSGPESEREIDHDIINERLASQGHK